MKLTKREVVERLLHVWEQNPNLRLGQLMHNAFGDIAYSYLFDDEVVSLFEQFLPKKRRSHSRKRGAESVS